MKSSPVQDTFVDREFSDKAIDYVRAKQEKDTFDPELDRYTKVWAWSSPIWIDECKIE